MLYPLKFKPRLVEKMWGGRKLQTVLGKPLPEGQLIGESWELYDFPPGVVDSSADWISAEVAEGPLAGRSLHSLVLEYGRQLHADAPLAPQGQFPILIKFLDAKENLSVQVHPDETYCLTHAGSHLKSEAWYILQSDAKSGLYLGLKADATRESFSAALQAGDVERLLRWVPAREGQCHYLPSGTVHALGAGLLVAEVQTPSDTTFRVFDFNRVDPSTGRPRKLHVAEAMECIRFEPAPAPQPRRHVANTFTTISRLVTSPWFTLEKVRFIEGVEQPVPYDQPVVWMVLEGSAEISVEGLPQPVRIERGQTVLLPAAMKNPMLRTLSDCAWLEVTFPSR